MNEMRFRYADADLVVSILVAVLAAAILWTASSYHGIGGVFPTYVGGFALIVALINVAQTVRRRLRGGDAEAGDDAAHRDVALREFTALLWPALLAALVYVLGFYVAIPIFMAVFMFSRRNVAVLPAVLVIGGFTLAVYLVFSLGLKAQIYSGLFW